jgi:hypothetical protein
MPAIDSVAIVKSSILATRSMTSPQPLLREFENIRFESKANVTIQWFAYELPTRKVQHILIATHPASRVALETDGGAK